MHTIILETATDQLAFDDVSGRLASLRTKCMPDVELLASAPFHPVFALQYLGKNHEYRHVDSRSARSTSVELSESSCGQMLALTFSAVGGMDLDIALTVRATKKDPLSRWCMSVRNGAGIRIVDVQFPFVVVPTTTNGAVIVPAGHGGQVIKGEGLAKLPADVPQIWRLVPENGSCFHYPGQTFAQFLAWYDDRVGLYLACDDTKGNVKLIKPVRCEPGVRLGIAHVGDWPTSGERTLEYDVLLGSFTGDWYDAADIYREWSLSQKWATPLSRRNDIPQWLLDSPPHIGIRLQGYLDDGPAPAIEQFLPYEKCVPLLEKVAERVKAPVVAVLMSWERGGPWVYPDCFPPIGGDESLMRFASMARERGWRVGSFCNGTRWVTQHLHNGYDGRAYFERHHGEKSVCRSHDCKMWAETWDANWRPSYICCMAQESTRKIALDFVRRLIGWGMESIQFFDQNVNASTFPCFSAEHGHPPIPGKWMAAAMEETIVAFRQVAEETGEVGVLQSTESPCNEYCLPLFQQSDARVSPPSCGSADYAPIYHYLFHECMILHGMMSTGAEPFALPIRTAWNCVLGEIPGAVMIGNGKLLNRDTFNWAPWEPQVGSNDDALEMIRTVTALRHGPGRDFLVYGRMQRPARVMGADIMEWEHAGRHHVVPTVAHAFWQSPDGRYSVVLANWTTQERCVNVSDLRLVETAVVHTSGRLMRTLRTTSTEDGFRVTVPALGCALIVGA